MDEEFDDGLDMPGDMDLGSDFSSDTDVFGGGELADIPDDIGEDISSDFGDVSDFDAGVEEFPDSIDEDVLGDDSMDMADDIGTDMGMDAELDTDSADLDFSDVPEDVGGVSSISEMEAADVSGDIPNELVEDAEFTGEEAISDSGEFDSIPVDITDADVDGDDMQAIADTSADMSEEGSVAQSDSPSEMTDSSTSDSDDVSAVSPAGEVQEGFSSSSDMQGDTESGDTDMADNEINESAMPDVSIETGGDDLNESTTDIDNFQIDTDTSSPLELEMLDEIPEDTLLTEDISTSEDIVESIPEDTEAPELPALDDEFQENWKRTPINNGEWSGERGQSKWIPDGEYTREILGRYGADGIEYTANLPDFGPFSAFEYDMDEALYTDSNSHQFQACNEAMMDYFSDLSDEYAGLDCDAPLRNTEYRDAMMNVFKCDEDALEDIQEALEIGETPYGYTWHHTETPGRMQLVPSAIHDAARHRGGQSIWGGGNQNR